MHCETLILTCPILEPTEEDDTTTMEENVSPPSTDGKWWTSSELVFFLGDNDAVEVGTTGEMKTTSMTYESPVVEL